MFNMKCILFRFSIYMRFVKQISVSVCEHRKHVGGFIYAEHSFQFLRTNAPLGPASSEGLSVCMSVCNTLAPLLFFPLPSSPLLSPPLPSQIIQINIQPEFSRIWDWFSIRRILFQCFLLQNHPFIPKLNRLHLRSYGRWSSLFPIVPCVKATLFVFVMCHLVAIAIKINGFYLPINLATLLGRMMGRRVGNLKLINPRYLFSK